MQALHQPVKRVALRDILTDPQLDRVVDIMRNERGSMERVRKLKEYFESIQGDLDKKGVVPGFLAYYLEYAALCSTN